MKKQIITGWVLLCTMLTACGQSEANLVGVIFERGNNSMWGNQFYIAVYPEEIATLRYIPEGSGELTVCEHIPITAEQWQTLKQTVEGLELKAKGSAWRNKLFGSLKQDGGEYRNLTLIWEGKKRREQDEYQWSQTLQAEALETLLEQLAGKS